MLHRAEINRLIGKSSAGSNSTPLNLTSARADQLKGGWLSARSRTSARRSGRDGTAKSTLLRACRPRRRRARVYVAPVPVSLRVATGRCSAIATSRRQSHGTPFEYEAPAVAAMRRRYEASYRRYPYFVAEMARHRRRYLRRLAAAPGSRTVEIRVCDSPAGGAVLARAAWRLIEACSDAATGDVA